MRETVKVKKRETVKKTDEMGNVKRKEKTG